MPKKQTQATPLTGSEPAPLWLNLEWSGTPLWRCAFCEFDTFEKPVIVRHWRSRHAPRVPKKEKQDDISS